MINRLSFLFLIYPTFGSGEIALSMHLVVESISVCKRVYPVKICKVPGDCGSLLSSKTFFCAVASFICPC